MKNFDIDRNVGFVLGAAILGFILGVSLVILDLKNYAENGKVFCKDKCWKVIEVSRLEKVK